MEGKTCLFIGRFQPLHNGHLRAIQWNLARGFQLVIVIGSLQEYATAQNPLDFRQRSAMIKTALAAAGIKKYQLVGLPDFQSDEQWVKKLLEVSNVQKDKAVVSSLNPWTEQVCQQAGIAVLRHPKFFNGLSATQVRKKIATGKEWKNLVPRSVFEFLKNQHLDKKIKDYQIKPEAHAAIK